MGWFTDLLGTTRAYFKIGGTTGVRLKNNSGNLEVRNTGDSADAAVTASKVNVSGDVIDINSDAAGSGADWKYTVQRPASGMTAAVTLTLPPDDGTSGQVLQTDGNGVLTWVSAGATGLALKMDTTSLAFGASSPVAMMTTGAADIIDHIDVIIDTAFDGTPSASVGITGTTSKYLAATDIDLTATAGTVFTVHPGIAAAGAEPLILTYSAGGASAGAARFIVFYGTPA
jgi:hypothetical protein